MSHHHHQPHGRRGVGGVGGATISPEERERRALIADLFDKLISAATLKGILGYYRQILELIPLKPTNFCNFYPKLKNVLSSWRADALWDKFDKRASHKSYRGGRACPNTRLLIIGAGPCGLRAAIEAQLLGAKVVVLEKRDRISRNNVLHLWPFVIHDLRALGAKKFFGKFCAGAIDHISIRQLQCILLKVALILGVEIHEGVGFEELVPPSEQADGKIGWRARVEPPEHPVAQYEFDVIIGADGKRNTLEGFRRKEFRGKLAIAITANFINRKSEAEAQVQEISGVAFIFNQKFFKDLKSDTGIDLENIVYYKDDTHYFVMTAKKGSLIAKGVIKQDFADTEKLLAPANVDNDMLVKYAREAADFSTDYKLPDLEFAVNYYGQPDVSMFDFTSMYAAENASRIIERRGFRLLQILVGDSLLEPFWPTGSGCARGFLSSMDACWAVRGWGGGRNTALEVIAERESIYRLLAQTTPENLNRDYSAYSLDPHTRYPNLNARAVSVHQVRGLFDTDNLKSLEQQLIPSNSSLNQDTGLKRRRKDSHVSPEILVQWLRRQVALFDGLEVRDLGSSLRDGRVLCAIITRYRPDLVRFEKLSPDDILINNQLAFDVLEKEYGIQSIITPKELEECEVPDELAMLTYYSEIYHTFRGEIPHVKHPKLDEMELRNEEDAAIVKKRSGKVKQFSQNQGLKLLSRIASSAPRISTGRKRTSAAGSHNTGTNATTPTDIATQKQRQRKRRSKDKNNEQLERHQERMKLDRLSRRQAVANERFKRSMALLQADTWRDSPSSQEQHSVFDEYDMLLYRLTTVDFSDRVHDLEMKLLYPDREMRLLAEAREKGGLNEEMADRIKSLEAKFKATAAEKKPHDLLRSIGRINKEDWQIKNIEDKIQENKYGSSRPSERPEKVPKWSKEQFNDKFMAVKSKLNPGANTGTSSYAQTDKTLRQLKATSQGISSIVDNFKQEEQQQPASMPVTTEPTIAKSSSRTAISLPQPPSGSEVCHFCNKRVYLVERMTADGRLFHRGCFRCEYCNTSLRLGNYSFEREGDWGGHFYCAQHALMPPSLKTKTKTVRDGPNQKAFPVSRTPSNASVVASSAAAVSSAKRPSGQTLSSTTEPATPERIEFKNESHVGVNSDVEEPPSEMDEAEWTDRNFGTSAAENSSDSGSDLTDSESSYSEAEDEVFEEAADQPLTTAGATLLLAHEWTKRYGVDKSSRINGTGNGNSPTDSAREAHLEEDDELSSRESDSESDGSESGTATEGEKDAAARELRRREVQVDARTPESGSDTEVASDEETTESTSSEEKDNENAATEIETDSEFEMEQPLARTFANIPEIYISDVLSGHKKSQDFNDVNELKMVHVKSGHIGPEMNGNRLYDNEKNKNTQQEDNKSASLTNLTKNIENRPKAISATQRNYLLSRTQSTEGIASKISLELKKKYLLGDTSNTFVQKSGSDVAIDNKVRNFLETISQQQKKLSITPPTTSSAFISNVPLTPPSPREIKLTPTPLIMPSDLKLPPSPSQYLRKQKELPQNGENFKHICGLGQKENKPPNGETLQIDEEVNSCPSPTTLSNTTSTTTTTVVSPISNPTIATSPKVINGETKVQDQEVDCRPRSPLHETSIVVPELPRKPETNSRDNNLAEEEEEEGEEEIESDSLSSESDDDVEDEKENKSKELESPSIPPPRVEIHDSQGEIVQADPESSASSDLHDATLAETELSDWAHDAMVSEDLDDQVFDIDLKNITRRRRPKNKKGPKPSDADHICGRSVPTSLSTSLSSTQHPQSLWDMDLQFADTGDESEQEVVSATNTGYVQLVEEEDVQTPIVELPPEHDSLEPCFERSSPVQAINFHLCEGDPCSGGATTDDTTTSEAVTVKNSPVIPDADPSHALYEAYVRKFQGRISPFSNARDSIDVRKARRVNNKISLETSLEEMAPSSSTPPDSLTTPIFETIEESSSPMKSPTTCRKLEVLCKERDKQRSLVHDLVLSSSTKKPGKSKRSPRPPPPSSPNLIPPSPPPTTNLALHANCQVPFADEPSPEVYATPPTHPSSANPSTAKSVLHRSKSPENSSATDNEVFATPAVRPYSVHMSQSSVPKSGTLPDTPLTHPEAFSLPDIRRALFQTPVAPPRKIQPVTIDSEKVETRREEARTRARLKSDRELGLSPEENLRALKQRLLRGRSGSDASLVDTPVSRPPTLVRAISVPSDTSSSKPTKADSAISAQEESSSSTSPKPTTHEPLSTASSVTPTSASNSSPASGGGKKKKSKIFHQLTGLLGFRQQASANLQTPNSSSWSTSSSSGRSLPYAPASSSSSSPIRDKLSKIVGKPRDKEKRSKSPSTVIPLSLNVFSSSRSGPPPVPPPPSEYFDENASPTTPTNAPMPRGSEESLSELDVEDPGTTTAPLSSSACDITATSVDGATSSRRQQRANKRMARQAQLKRLRMAQEIQRQLEEVEVKQRELENRGVRVERALRGEGEHQPGEERTSDDGDLLREWFELMRERSELQRFERELQVRAQELELDDRHARLQGDLRERLNTDDGSKTPEDVARERQILTEMLELVERKDRLIQLLEADRQRYQEEDRDLEAQMLAKGVRLTSLRNNSHN